MEEVTGSKSASRGVLVGKLVYAIVPLGFAGWIGLRMIGRIREIRAHPDLNGDGKWSILDVPNALFSIVLEVGHRYQAVLARTNIGRFLEMRAEDPNLFWSIVLAAFTYVLFAGSVFVLIDQTDQSK